MAQKVAEEKAPADQAADAKPKSGKLVLIVGLVTLIIVAQAIITYVLMPKPQEPKPEDAQAAAATKAHPAGEGTGGGSGDEKDAPENETAEVAVGDFNCTNSTAAEGMVMHITFKLVAVASGAQAKALEDQLKSKNAQVRQLVNRIVRSSKMEDLDDPNMGTIKRLIRQEVNKLLRKSFIIEIVITDIRTMQQ